MIVARQFIAWYPCANGNRPVEYGMMGSDRRATIRTINQSGGKDQTVPYGTDSLLNAFQAINCLATIIASLRDGRFLPTFQPRKLSGLATFIQRPTRTIARHASGLMEQALAVYRQRQTADHYFAVITTVIFGPEAVCTTTSVPRVVVIV
jgi:hypothetical protein